MADNFSDHNIPHTELFIKHKIKNMLEFGLGKATEQFLREVDKVTSIEIYTSDKVVEEKLKISGPQWVEKFKNEFADIRWRIIMIEAREGILKAEYEVTGHDKIKRGENPTSNEYIKEINYIVSMLGAYDYVFVDAGIHLRGDIVNALFQRFPIIGAHDTNDKAIYGYNRVVVPENYKVEEHPSGCGTTFWIKQYEISSL